MSKVTTFGVYNTETKELFRFNDYPSAFRAYTMILDDLVQDDYRIPSDWALVLIQDEEIVQLNQCMWKITCKKIKI